MKQQSKYKEIGNLQLFKPDYINANKKTLLTSDIIKDYLRKRKGKYYYKVNYIKNKFKFSNEIDDLVNKRMHYKLIQNSYREMKSEIYRRHLNDDDFKESKSLKLIDNNNNNLVKKKIRSRNKEISRNSHITFHYRQNIFDKYNKFRQANSEVKILPTNNIKELSTNFIDSNGNTSLNKNSKKITPSDNSYLIGFIKKNKIKKLFKRNSPNETNSTQRNTYKNNNDISNEIIKSFSNNITLNKLPILNNNKDKKEKKVIDPYFSLNNDPKTKLKMQYNFFRLDNEDDMKIPINKFRLFQKKLYSPQKVITNKKFHFSYVQYVIDNIKRKEKEKEKELNDSKKENNKPKKILIKKKINRNNNKYVNNDNNINEIMFRSFNGKIF